MPPVGFEPTISAGKRPKTYTLRPHGHWNRLFAEQSAINQCTVQPFAKSDDTRCCVNAIFPPEDGHVNAQNMLRIIV